MFDPVNLKKPIPEVEADILKTWKKNKTFEKSIENRPQNKTWTFLDGPPFITGLPHYGSLLSSIPKDLFPRFWTMKGYRVRRVWGWDCHGLPVENKVENKLNLKTKKDIEEKVGVKKFINECKLYVKESSSEWEWYIDRVARWVDFKNAYRTMDRDYMESVMWVFKSLYDKGYVYKGRKVTLYCPHCVTPISNFEVAMDADNYQEVAEPANVYKYQLKGQPNTYLLAWSTTPWNKIATPALAVNPLLTYVKVEQGGEKYILAKNTLEILKKDKKYKIIDEFPGDKLVGLLFVPHYDFYEVEPGKRANVVLGATFVTEDEGTGVVTIAAYGEDDMKLIEEENVQVVLHVDEEGKLAENVPNGWAGMNYLDVNPLVNKDLEKRGLMYKEEEYAHTVPTCWRCHTRLYYAPQNAWFVNVASLKDKLVKTNEEVNWFPEHFKEGRYRKSVESAPDWCISRNRYWGSPVPVWETEDGHRIVVGSIAELEELSGQKIKDLHKPEIDDIEITLEDGRVARRVPEVLDSWIEAGSASFAERHYPFEGEVSLDSFYPPDFIVEYTGQIRAWFYVLHVIGAALYDSIAFKNVVVTGVILGTDGRKMSKNFKNYPDPKEMIEKYGGDALRLYLMGSVVMRGEDILISEEEYRNQVKGFIFPLRNVFNFFVTYANVDKWKAAKSFKMNTPKDSLNRWIVSRLMTTLSEYEKYLEEYNTPSAIALLRDFLVNDLSGWYVRRIRGNMDKETYKTLYFALTTFAQMIAPVAPFVAEEIYTNLVGKSVHLSDWPKFTKKFVSKELEEEMSLARQVVEMVHAERQENSIRVRQPLSELVITSPSKFSKSIIDLIADEVNVMSIVQKEGKKLSIKLDKKITDELKVMGDVRDLIRQIQVERKEVGVDLKSKVNVTLPDWPEEYEREIKSKALINQLKKGKFSVRKA